MITVNINRFDIQTGRILRDDVECSCFLIGAEIQINPIRVALRGQCSAYAAGEVRNVVAIQIGDGSHSRPQKVYQIKAMLLVRRR